MYGQPMYGQPMYVPPPPVIMQPQPSPIVVVQGQQQQNRGGGSYCPVCNTNTASKVQYEVGGKTWMMCIVLFLFTGVCCWIPFVCDDCKQRRVNCVTCDSAKA